METRKIFDNIDIKNRYELMLRKEMYSLFIDTDVKHQVNCLKLELDELLKWIENNDSENIAEEVGDVIMNTIQLLQSLLKKWIIDESIIKKSWENQKKEIIQTRSIYKRKL